MFHSVLVRAQIKKDSRAVACAAIVLCYLVFFLRWPEILLDAQFWGEDGWSWWPDARKMGVASMWSPHAGYLVVVCRLVGLLTVPLPLAWGPFLFAFVACVLDLMPAVFFISSRGASICPSLWLRCAIALAWCALPNSWEVHGNLTNTQWYLSILSLLILISAPPLSLKGWVFDSIMLVVGALSGPFSILLSPVAILRAWQVRSKTSYARMGIIVCGGMLQVLVVHSAQRGIPPDLGASPIAFVRLISAQVILATMVGHRHLLEWYQLRLWQSAILPWALFLLGLSLCVDAFRRWPLMRLCTLYMALALAACLSHPLGSSNLPFWLLMLHPDSGTRYLFLTLVFWMTVVVLEASVPPWGWNRILASVLLAISLVWGIPRDWRFPAVPDRNFYVIAREYDAAPKGKIFTIPVRPGSQAVYRK